MLDKKATALPMMIVYKGCKKILLFTLVLAIVLLTHSSVITFNLMYPEQPSIYLANQTIHHVSDLVYIYLHPQLLNQNIPFFRPSGHFLIYQIVTPWLGWHNTKALIMINLVFLAGIGYFLIEIYQRIFPRFKIGGYLAFSLYLMHPALSLVRVTIMHFDFAYVFFVLLALYLFILFCQRRERASLDQTPKNKTLRVYFLLALSLLMYVIAVTFKESAVMLGPVMMCYFWIHAPSVSFSGRTNRQALAILIAITVTSLLLGWYLIASWPSLAYPGKIFAFNRSLGTINAFFIDIWGYNKDIFDRGYNMAPDLAWRTIVFPYSARVMIWAFVLISMLSMMVLFLPKKCLSPSLSFISAYRRAIIFLFIATLLFLILPFAWATAGPWHYSLALVCIFLIMGFSVEYLCERVYFMITLSLVISVLNLYLAIHVDEMNIKKYDYVQLGKIGLAVNRNAILHPPNIKNKLTPESVIVVEDSSIHNDYLMGNAAYPFLLFLNYGEYEYVVKRQSPFFLKFQPVYSGTLFRYAYLMPSLKEELYPFKVENMDDIPNEIIYNWLVHFHDIFCLGYDEKGDWHDKTSLFKQQLLKIKAKRELKLNNYTTLKINTKNKMRVQTKVLTYPDPQLCQFACDQNKNCVGFVYQFIQYDLAPIMQCRYATTAYVAGSRPCPNCTWYQKTQ